MLSLLSSEGFKSIYEKPCLGKKKSIKKYLRMGRQDGLGGNSVATKPMDSCSIPRTHTAEENGPSQVVLWHAHAHCGLSMCTYMHNNSHKMFLNITYWWVEGLSLCINNYIYLIVYMCVYQRYIWKWDCFSIKPQYWEFVNHSWAHLKFISNSPVNNASLHTGKHTGTRRDTRNFWGSKMNPWLRWYLPSNAIHTAFIKDLLSTFTLLGK